MVLKTGLINTFLRGLTLGSKFLLLLFLARMMTPAEVGVYGLVVVTITVTLYLLGFDFHTYNTREILAAGAEVRPRFVRDQVVFHLAVYAVVLPAMLLVFASGTLPWRFAGWFYALLVLEHLSQEAYRLLVTFSRSSIANVVLFLRAGVWVFAVIAAGMLWPGAVSLERVFAAWTAGVAASIGLAAGALRDLKWRGVWGKPVDWIWVRRGLKVSLRLFAATICLLGVQYADRYFLQHFHGAAAVGVYTFFWQVANTMQIFVYTAVAIVLCPRLVESYQRGDMVSYRRYMRKLVLGVIGTIVVVGAGLAVIIRPVLGLVGKEIYREHLTVGWILLAAMAILCLSYIPQFSLYVRRRDRSIVAASVIAVAAALGAQALLVPAFGPAGAAWGTLGAFAVLTVAKTVFALRGRGEGAGDMGTETERIAAGERESCVIAGS